MVHIFVIFTYWKSNIDKYKVMNLHPIKGYYFIFILKIIDKFGLC